MRSHTFLMPAVLCAFLALAGCATPQVALEQARQGTSLVGQLETAMTEFRRVEQNAEESRSQSLARQMQDLEDAKGPAARDARARLSAGDKATAALIARLMADADALAADAAASRAARQANETVLATLITPLPSTVASTTVAQKKLAEMGTELSYATRAKELLDWTQTIKAAVDANKKKIDEAEAAVQK